MKRRVFWIAAAAIAALILCLSGWLLLSTETLLLLPEGTLIGTYPSPDGTACIRAYRCDGGATVDTAVRCEVAGTGVLRHNLYWAYHTDGAEVVWLDAETCRINGITLRARTGQYDYRREGDANSHG